ncbi:MAG: hypothetical protein OEV78_00130 [Spirochaetia bacterium]|nr:hypothetical protein [Spirochaetia bacterium]
MKYSLAFVLLLFSISCIFSQSGTNDQLSDELLTSQRWTREFEGSWGYEIEFYSDHTFIAVYFAEGGGNCAIGTYKLQSSTVVLNSSREGFSDYEDFKSCQGKIIQGSTHSPIKDFKHLNCQLKNNEHPVKYRRLLSCTDTKTFVDQRTKVKKGDSIVLDNIPCISLGNSMGVTISEARLRVKPNIQSDLINYACSNCNDSFLPYVPKNIPIEVFAKKIESDTINGVTGHWIYVGAPVSHAFTGYGWMFDPYVKIIDN